MALNESVVIAGATGDLGQRVTRGLCQKGARVRALVRLNSASDKIEKVRALGAEPVPVDFESSAELAKACEGASVVVSALAGLSDVIVDVQSRLLDGSVAAGVPRFIPSDFAIDFTKIPRGSNRNLDFRSEFKERLDKAMIRSTSILNGAFMDLLTGTAPFILFDFKRVLCWGDPDQLMDWTTIDDTARYTARAALDPSTPRILKIAGDQLSARDLAALMTELSGERFKVFRPGGLGLFDLVIGITKLVAPQRNEHYPPWQGMQYMRNMYEGSAKFERLDNARYEMSWTTAREVLAKHLAQ